MKITIKNLQKKERIPPKRIRQLALKVLSSEGVKKSGELTICFVNNASIRELNLLYRGDARPTDVLVFDLAVFAEKKHYFSDIVISCQQARINAGIFGTSLQQELDRYVVHGILHMLGFNDQTKKEKAAMRAKEDLYGHL